MAHPPVSAELETAADVARTLGGCLSWGKPYNAVSSGHVAELYRVVRESPAILVAPCLATIALIVACVLGVSMGANLAAAALQVGVCATGHHNSATERDGVLWMATAPP